MTELLTVVEAGELIGIKPVTLYQAIREGRLTSVKVLGKKGITKQDALEYKARTANVGAKGGRPRKTQKEATQ